MVSLLKFISESQTNLGYPYVVRLIFSHFSTSIQQFSLTLLFLKFQFCNITKCKYNIFIGLYQGLIKLDKLIIFDYYIVYNQI